MHAQIKVEKALRLHPHRRVVLGFVAVCRHHPQSDPMIEPWRGRFRDIEDSSLPWFEAKIEVSQHNLSHPDPWAQEFTFDQLISQGIRSVK